MRLNFAPDQAARLAGRAASVARAAGELSLFGESDPDLARECGVEISALEARTILSGGAPARIAAAAGEASRWGRPAVLAAEDMDAMERLEHVVALGKSRIDLKSAALDAEASQEPLARLGGFIGLAGAAAGFLKSIL
jgi:hypothetical protein